MTNWYLRPVASSTFEKGASMTCELLWEFADDRDEVDGASSCLGGLVEDGGGGCIWGGGGIMVWC